MRYPLIILTLSLLLTACSRRDVPLNEQIVGTWTNKAQASTMMFGSDGAFSMVVGKATTMTGTWQIKDQDLLLTLAGGGEGHGKIISMNAHEFVFISGTNTLTMNR